MKTRIKMSGGQVMILIVALIVIIVLALQWVGQHQAQISAGIGTLVKVVAACSVAAGAAVAGRMLIQARQPRAEDPPPPETVHVPSVQVPLAVPRGDEPLALPPGGTHYHFHGLDEAEMARVIQLASENDLHADGG